MAIVKDEQMEDQSISTSQEKKIADVQELDDMPPQNQEDEVKEDIKSSEETQDEIPANVSSETLDENTSSSGGKLFIGGLSRDTTTEKLSNHFKTYGELTDSVIMKDRESGHPRGFGFVTYADPSICDIVLKDSHIIDGRTVDVKRSVPRENMAAVKGPKTKKIFVGGIPPSVKEDELKDHFSKFGKVVEHQIMLYHSTGRSRGFGFVSFESEQAVEDILSKGTMHDFAGKQVEIKKAEPKESTQKSTRGPRDSYGDVRGSSNGGYRSGGGYSGLRGEDYRGGYSGGLVGTGFGSGGGYFGGSLGVGYGRSALDAGYDSLLSYGSLSRGYGGYLDSDPYGGLPYGGYGSAYGGSYSSGAGYDLGGYGAGYGAGRYGAGSGSSARYHPYRK